MIILFCCFLLSGTVTLLLIGEHCFKLEAADQSNVIAAAQ